MSDEDDLPDADETEGRAEGTVDAGDPKAVEKLTRKAATAKQEVAEFWARSLADPVGRRALWELLSQDFHAFSTQFAAGPTGFPDGNATWFQFGQQSCGQHLYLKLGAIDPGAVLLMHQENDAVRFPPKRPAPKRKPRD